MVDEYSYAIIGREYVIDEDTKKQRMEAVNEFRTDLELAGLCEQDAILDENILILWNGFTEKDSKTNQKKFNHDTDVLLERFLRRIADKISAEGDKGIADARALFKIYIDDPYSFYDDGQDDFFSILKRIYLVYKITGIVPTIMEGNFLLETRKEDLARDVENTIEEIVTEPKATKGYVTRFNRIIEAVEREHFHGKAVELIDSDYFKRFFTSIEMMMDYAPENLLREKKAKTIIRKDGDEEIEKSFIDVFIQYQNGKSGTDCSYDINKDSPNSWYVRARSFEQNIWYAEYMNAFYDEVISSGLVMGKIKEYMFEVLPMYKERVRNAAYNHGNPRIGIYEIYEELDYIRSIVDVKRCAITCYKHYKDLRNSKSKEEFASFLEKHGVSDADMDIRFI